MFRYWNFPLYSWFHQTASPVDWYVAAFRPSPSRYHKLHNFMWFISLFCKASPFPLSVKNLSFFFFLNYAAPSVTLWSLGFGTAYSVLMLEPVVVPFSRQLVDSCEPLHFLSKPSDNLIIEIETNHVQLLGLTQLPVVTPATCSSLFESL